MISIWEQRSFTSHRHLVVVGSGIVGLFTALHYQRRFPDHRVWVLEKGLHPSGASVKNAGFACFGSPSELLADIAAEGEAAALARVEERWRGLQELRAELGDAGIGYEPSGGHELFGNDHLYTRVAEGFDGLNGSLRGIFGRSVYEWADTRKGDLGLQAEHLTFTDLEGSVDSGKLVRGLLAKVRAAGVQVHFNAGVTAIEEGTEGASLLLATGERIKARQVVVATNGYARELLPALDVLPARGQVLLTAPLPGLRLKGTFHANEGYVYFRDLDGAVLLGGGRDLDKAGETTTADGVTPLIQDHLEHLLRTVIIPGTPYAIARRWSGVMGFGTSGKAPLVERVSPHVVAAVRLSGMGVAIGIRVARRAAGLMHQH
jgi:glycine/D-amino acid oxidase-like deaminating enzyme